MPNCIIFCAGELNYPVEMPKNDDYVIAADGGYRHTQALGITPNAILGDFDSLGFVPEGAEVFPVEKDDTDAMLAVRHGLKMGCDTFYIYGGMEGQRLDHTIANLQTLLYLEERGARGFLFGKRQIATVIKNDTLHIPDCKGTVSVFAMGGEATGVTIRGLQYVTENITLSPTFPLGVSNHGLGEEATITVENGTLLIIYDRKEDL